MANHQTLLFLIQSNSKRLRNIYASKMQDNKIHIEINMQINLYCIVLPFVCVFNNVGLGFIQNASILTFKMSGYKVT